MKTYKTIWTKIEYLKKFELKALPDYDDRRIKTKRIKSGDKSYSNFCGLNLAEYRVERESFTIISIDFLLVHGNKYYL